MHVICDFLPSEGGPVAAARGLSEAQASLGHHVTIVTTQAGKSRVEPPLGVNLHAYPCDILAWRFSRSLGKHLRSHAAEADIAHIHTIWGYPTWAAAEICRSLKVPYICRPCGMLEHWSLAQRKFKKRLFLSALGNTILKGAAAIHFTSRSERANSAQICAKYNSFIIPVGVAMPSHRDLSAHSNFLNSHQALKNRKIILFLGRLHYKKQPDIAIRAFEIVSSQHPDAVLVLAGPGEFAYVKKLRHLTKQLNLEKKVFFIGMIEGPAVREAYQAATIFVLPSLQENFGISVAEAMAEGCPVIVSNQVGLSDEIIRTNAGVVCQATTDRIAESIARLLDNPEERCTMSRNGQQLVANNFTWKKIADDVIQVYDDILHQRRTHPSWQPAAQRHETISN